MSETEQFKYSGKNPLETLDKGEPFFFLRAHDRLAPDAIRAYADLLKGAADIAWANGENEKGDRFLKQSLNVLRVARAFIDWQDDNPGRVKLPD